MRVESFRTYQPLQEASFESLVSQMGRLTNMDHQARNSDMRSDLEARKATSRAQIDERNQALAIEAKERANNAEAERRRAQQATMGGSLLAGGWAFALAPIFGIAGIGQLAVGGLAGAFTAFSREFGSVFGSIGSFLGDAGSAIGDAAGDVADGAKKAAADAVDAIGDAASGAADAAGDAAKSVGDAISDLF